MSQLCHEIGRLYLNEKERPDGFLDPTGLALCGLNTEANKSFRRCPRNSN
jgi:hypothetical protein